MEPLCDACVFFSCDGGTAESIGIGAGRSQSQVKAPSIQTPSAYSKASAAANLRHNDRLVGADFSFFDSGRGGYDDPRQQEGERASADGD